MAGTGKISALPRDIRDELARRLDDGAVGSEVLPWLNALPRVQEILTAKNQGPISEQNLSNWRETGFAQWQSQQDRTRRHRDLAAYSRQLGEDSADIFSGGAAVAGGLLMEIIDSLDGDAQQTLLADKPENLPAFVNALARLQGEQAKREMLHLKRQKQAHDDKRLALDVEKFQTSTCEALLKKATSSEIQKIVSSSAPRAAKMEQLRLAIFGAQGVKEAPKV